MNLISVNIETQNSMILRYKNRNKYHARPQDSSMIILISVKTQAMIDIHA